MFNLGAGEVLAIALIALIVLGPEKIPGAMRQLGRFMGEVRRMSTGFQEELKHALDEDEDQSLPPIPAPGASEPLASAEAPDTETVAEPDSEPAAEPADAPDVEQPAESGPRTET